eukprot:1128138_1
MNLRIFGNEKDNSQFQQYYILLMATDLCQVIPNGITKLVAEFATGTIMACSHCHEEESILYLYQNVNKEFYVHSSKQFVDRKPDCFCATCMNKLKCMRCFNVIANAKHCKFHCFQSE